jgi:hypothetical protein
MSFFRSAALRRVIYAVVLALALVRVATRLHSEPLPAQLPPPSGIVAHMAH